MNTTEWLDTAVEDLRPFCDLGTEPAVTPFAEHAEVVWFRAGKRHETSMRQSADRVFVSDNGAKEISYRQFLASPAVADLTQVAKNIVTLATKRRGATKRTIRNKTIFTHDWYVDPRLTQVSGFNVTPGRAADMLGHIADSPEDADLTNVVFLTAAAGQGKSTALRNAHLLQAQRYVGRETQSITFFIDAQGRGLAKLADVLSRELNDLRVNLPYEAIYSLVREGLITLIVDGFDELIGARGTYEGAFTSLTNFLERLDGRGTVIAAARSAFLTQEYQSRPQLLAGTSGRHQISQLEIVPWTSGEINDFLELADETSSRGLISKDVKERFAQVGSADGDLLSRPLFARDVLISLVENPHMSIEAGGYDLLKVVVDAYVKRECEGKLVNEAQLGILDPAQLSRYYVELAQEMWDLETREIDTASARLIMEVLTDEWGITSEDARIAIDRVGQMPFMGTIEGAGHAVAFEHELFFSYFVAGPLYDGLFGGAVSPSATMARARLTGDEADLVAWIARQRGRSISELLESLSATAVSRHPRQNQIRENCATAAASILRYWSDAEGDCGKVRLTGLHFEGDSLAGVRVSDAKIRDCSFNRVDLRNSRWTGSAEESVIYSAVVDEETTKLSIDGFDAEAPIHQVECERAGIVQPIYDLEERDRILSAIGLRSPEPPAPRFDVQDPVIEVVTQLCRAFDHMNPVGERHSHYQNVFRDPQWKAIKLALIESQLVRVDPPRQTSGPRQDFLRRNFSTPSLLGALVVEQPDDARFDQFWQSLSA